MTFKRNIPSNIQSIIEKSSSPDALLGFITISTASLIQPIRAVSDVLPYVLRGDLYEGFPFGFSVLTDNDSQPESRITIQNVDKRIGESLRKVRERANIQLEIYSSADFDLTVNPRTEIGTATKIYGFVQFELSDVEVLPDSVTGRVILMDPSAEPWPATRATQVRTPGLFR